jgi:hypothetical protein
VTIVRPRLSASPRHVTARAVRPGVPRQPWPLTLLLLGLSVVAGLAAGTYLLKARWSAQTSQPSSPRVEEAAGVAEQQSPAPQTATTTDDSQLPQPAARLPEPSPPAVPTETAAAAADAKIERPNEAKSSTRAPQPTTSENRRAPAAEPASRREAPAAAKASRPPTPAREKTVEARRTATAPATAQRAQRPEARLITARPRRTSPPVLSPSPPNKSEKRKVIPWP